MDSSSALPDPAPVAAASGWWAVCLCADWCGTCRAYRAIFDALALEHPDVRFVWVDIEDEADVAGDMDVETFPTLLIAENDRVRFAGPLLPQAPVLARLLASLRAGPGGPAAGAQAQAVFARVRTARR